MRNFLTLSIFACFFSSCNNEEPIYSHNRTENGRVNENLSEIRTMSRSEWINVDENLKIPLDGIVAYTEIIAFSLAKGIFKMLALFVNQYNFLIL